MPLQESNETCPYYRTSSRFARNQCQPNRSQSVQFSSLFSSVQVWGSMVHRGGGTLAGLVEAGVGDFAFVPFGVTPFMGLPAMPVAICWLLMTECASKPETKFLHLHFVIRLQSFISS